MVVVAMVRATVIRLPIPVIAMKRQRPSMCLGIAADPQDPLLWCLRPHPVVRWGTSWCIDDLGVEGLVAQSAWNALSPSEDGVT